MNKALKRYLFLVHRWFGIAMCLLIGLWFATGIIMMYVEYPELTEEERLELLPALALPQVRVAPDAATAILALDRRDIGSLKLSTVLGRPAYQLATARGAVHTVFADDGSILQGLSPSQAELAAQDSISAAPGSASHESNVQYLAGLEMDQWTVSSILDPHRPLHKVAVNDAAGTVFYLSNATGQIVRDTNRNERFWNWLGSTIHWIYPWQLRRHADLWADIIIYLSLAGIVSVISGGIIGWLRLRVRKPYHGERVTPYRGMQKWHHLLGLGSLLFLSTFMFSGLMSMAPWGIFNNATDASTAIARYTDGAGNIAATYADIRSIAGESGIKEVEWTRIKGEGYLVLARSAHAKEVISNNGPLTAAILQNHIEQAIPDLLPHSAITQVELVAAYDNYYYSHHNRYRPLPVMRVKFDDGEQSWFHLDMRTGKVLDRLTHTDRVARWLYNGLHSLDFSLLFQHRPIWDVAMIMLCMLGAAFSVTSVWIGWRRLQN